MTRMSANPYNSELIGNIDQESPEYNENPQLARQKSLQESLVRQESLISSLPDFMGKTSSLLSSASIERFAHDMNMDD